jgi:membrane-associated phospholipid phosphatase
VLAYAFTFFAIFLAVFAGAAALGDHYPARFHVGFGWEDGIPLWPWTAAIYLSLDLMGIPLLVRFPTVKAIRPVLLALTFELTVASACFLLFPVVDGFHDPPATGLLAFARSMALQHNYFPSLHVALAFTAAGLLDGVWMFVWATLIALSTLTTHQHYLVDVFGGMALAWAGTRVYRWLA